MRGSYFILRRNLRDYKFANHLSDEEAKTINELVQKFALGLSEEYAGDLITPDQQDYNKYFEQLYEELDLESDFEKNSAKISQTHHLKFTKGTGIFRSSNNKLLYQIVEISMSNPQIIHYL